MYVPCRMRSNNENIFIRKMSFPMLLMLPTRWMDRQCVWRLEVVWQIAWHIPMSCRLSTMWFAVHSSMLLRSQFVLPNSSTDTSLCSVHTQIEFPCLFAARQRHQIQANSRGASHLTAYCPSVCAACFVFSPFILSAFLVLECPKDAQAMHPSSSSSICIFWLRFKSRIQ